MLRNCFGDDRIGHEMRIAERVHVAGRARDVCRHVHQSNSLGRDDASRLACFDFWITRVLQQRRKPADFQFGAAIDQDVGVAQGDDKTGTGVDEVRILRRLGQDRDLDFVATNFARDRTEIGQRRDDVEFCRTLNR